MILKLKVPKKTTAEFVNQGNFEAKLKPGGIVETTSREFADWLIREHGLEEILTTKQAEEKTEGQVEEKTEGGTE